MEIPAWYNSAFDPYCLEVGRLSDLWASLERLMDDVIWELMDVDARCGACVTAQMIGPGPGVRAMLSLIDERGVSAELQLKFKRFGKSAQTLGAKRNRYAHDVVLLGAVNGNLAKQEITADKKLRIEKIKVEVKAIRALWINIQAADVELVEPRRQLNSELPAWSRKRYAQSLPTQPPETPDQI